MKIAICDDEKKLRKDLRHLLELHLDLKGIPYEIQEYESGDALLKDEHKEDIQLLFLDIEMPGKGGMETAHGLRDANLKMLIIFVTAYPDYVFQGYEVQAFHYILKPYQETKLRDVLDRALTELNSLAEQYYLIEQKSQTLRLNLRSVCYFKSEKRTIYAFSKQNHETSFYGKLEEVSAEMPSFFQRIHNRYLVNLNYVTKLDKNTCICNGEELPVSRAYKQELSVAFARMMLK